MKKIFNFLLIPVLTLIAFSFSCRGGAGIIEVNDDGNGNGNSFTPLTGSIADVSAGGAHMAAIKSDGTLWAWGFGGHFRLGTGTLDSYNSPVQVGVDNDWESVSAGSIHTLAIKTDGNLWAWGTNDYGQLGDRFSVGSARSTPYKITTNNYWTKVLASSSFSLALRNGNLFGWGRNNLGQLGLGSSLYQTPNIDPIGIDNDWETVSTGTSSYRQFSLAIKTNGSLWAWGYGCLGNGNATQQQNYPVKIGNDMDWKEVAAGESHSAAIKTNGTLWIWTLTDGNIPHQVGTSNDWEFVAAGDHHCIAIKTDGSLWAWGDNSKGQLGIGSFTNKNSPVQVGQNKDWIFIAAGSYSSAAITSNGSLWTWGSNGNGMLGNGSTTNSNVPVQIFKGED